MRHVSALVLFLGLVATASRAATPLPLVQDVILEESVTLGRIADIAVDDSGQIYVLDRGFNKVHVFDERGSFLYDIGREGEGPAEFYSPSCLAVDSHGHVFVAGASNRIVIMDTNGISVGCITRDHSAPIRSMRMGQDGSLFVTFIDIFEQKVIHRYAKPLAEEPTVVASFCDSYGAGRDVDTRTETVFGGGFIDVTNDGDLYYVQMAPQLVRIFSPDGVLLKEHDARLEESPFPSNPDFTRKRLIWKAPPISTSVIALKNDRFLTTQAHRLESGSAYWLTDLYDRDGTRMYSDRRSERFSVICADADDRLYAVEETDTDIRVVRYRLEIPAEVPEVATARPRPPVVPAGYRQPAR